MSQEIDPILLQEELQNRIRRYLLTALPISRRFPNLRAEAERLINQPEMVIKGPFLEAIPDFPKGASLKDLVEEGLLHEGFAQLGSTVYERRLHAHQEEAIRSVVGDRKNIVVATGTGSGKTECFLFPLIDSLLKANIAGRPGIRAILVYPLNALANDQLYQRLAPIIAGKLAEYGLTVGRYTGQTRADMSRKQIETQLLAGDFIKQLFPDGIPRNWLLSREEMLETPPNVLITNYAMLEHLLLLPHNRPLFNHVDLKFLVLDEVHSYAGTQATEVALLLRKLINRYARNGEIRFIGTSASLSAAPAEQAKISTFAARLFHAPFAPPITAQRERHRLLCVPQHNTAFSIAQWKVLKDLLMEARAITSPAEAITRWNNRVIEEEIDLLVDETEETLAQAMAKVLGADPKVQELAVILSSEGSILVSEVADRLFGNTATSQERQEAVRAMVTLGAYARETPETYPLLPARYHIFTKGVEDATVELAALKESNEHATQLRFAREFRDPESNALRFRLLTCRKCGELYFEGWENSAQQKIQPEPGKGLKRSVFWLKPKDSVVLADDETESDPEGGHKEVECFIHPATGACLDFLPEDANEVEWIKTWRAPMAKQDDDDRLGNTSRVTHCHSCGSVERNEIVTPFHPGDQALSATICDALYEAIPAKPEAARNPGGGRSLLVFSDNRQDAAFFAPNLQRSHEEILLRWRTVRELKRNDGVAKLLDVATSLAEDGLLRKGFTGVDGRPLKPEDADKHFKALLLAEFCTPGGARSSLEDLGIVEVKYAIDLPYIAERARLPEEIGEGIVRFVLDVMRSNRAIKLPLGISGSNTPESQFYWGNYAQAERFYRLHSEGHRYNLLPSIRPSGEPYSNRFVHVLRDRLGLSDWSGILSRLWQSFMDDTDTCGLESPTDGDATSLVMRPGIIKLILSDEDTPAYRCNKCGAKSRWHLAKKCVRWKCNGSMEEIPASEWREELRRNHYHHLYRSKSAIPTLLAREHTAALGVDLKERIESDFKKGELNLLSCSTTMEMGIDLGDLSSVMLRNVPPGVANYQQRAGRAGRRGQGAPVSLTYARNRRYDQSTYDEAQAFLRKPPGTPFVHLGNERLIMRHQFSIFLSDFLSHRNLTQHGLQIGQLFGLEKIKFKDGSLSTDQPSPFGPEEVARFSKSLLDWADSEDSENAAEAASNLHTTVLEDLSPEEAASLVFDPARLKSAFVETLSSVAEQFSYKYSFYWDRRDQAMSDGNPRQAARYENQALRLANQQMVNYASKHGVIPTYSFPVDSIELDIVDGSFRRRGSEDVELSRDARIGIVEYAPNSEVVANGRVWVSRGIDTNPRAFMPLMFYKICKQCRHIEQQPDQTLLPFECPACGAPLEGFPRRYVEPLSFVTCTSESDGLEPGSRRIKPPPALEQMLIGNAPEASFQGTDLIHVSVAYQDARSGRMVVINQGQGSGFLKCNRCSRAEIKRKKNQTLGAHKNPKTGRPCGDTDDATAINASTLDLAHTFFTDVLQIRTGLSIEVPEDLDHGMSPFEFKDQVARTVAEAVRLSAVEILSVPDGEITASFRWTASGGLEIVLSDSVSGGAGYVGQIKKAGARALFEEAKTVLDCPKRCTSGCSSCLRSYSNQFYWDQFRRTEGLRYVQKVLSYRQDDAFLKSGSSSFAKQDLLALIDQAAEIIWFSDQLGEFTGSLVTDSESTSKEPPIETFLPGSIFLKKWLSGGKTVQLAATHVPDFAAFELPKARRFVEAFSEEFRTSRLKINKLPKGDVEFERKPMVALRLPGQLDWTCVYCLHATPSLLASSDFPDTLRRKEVSQLGFCELLPENSQVDPLRANANSQIKRMLLEPGRDVLTSLQPVLEELVREAPQIVTIQDRYMVSMAANLDSLEKFLSSLADCFRTQNVTAPKELRLVAGPASGHGGVRQKQEWQTNLKQVERRMKQHAFWSRVNTKTELREFRRGSERDYHDRLITAESWPERKGKAKGKKLVIEMTGGIDILMDDRETTRVFICRMPV